MKKIVFLFALWTPLILCAQTEEFAQVDTVTTKEGDLTIHPILHGALVMKWQGKTIYVDPYGGPEMYRDFTRPDLLLITDIHGDHLHFDTLDSLGLLVSTTIIAPPAVVEKLQERSYEAQIVTLKNSEKTEWEELEIEAIPMYNLPEREEARHPKGRGNGYVIEFAKTKVYISGDTEDIPEMRKLKGIDLAFVCMNLPYTMDVIQAASAVADFKPEVVYPYHFRGKEGLSDIEKFKAL